MRRINLLFYFKTAKDFIMDKSLKKTKFRKGISGVVVALLLVLVGVVAVAGIQVFLKTQSTAVQTETTSQLNKIVSDSNSSQQ
jgi:Tfp pilus assembly protein PilV